MLLYVAGTTGSVLVVYTCKTGVLISEVLNREVPLYLDLDTPTVNVFLS